MADYCKNNKFIKNSALVSSQVLAISVFLSLFFFIYIVQIEKQAFSTQLEIIVDDIIGELNTEYSDNLRKLQSASDPNITLPSIDTSHIEDQFDEALGLAEDEAKKYMVLSDSQKLALMTLLDANNNKTTMAVQEINEKIKVHNAAIKNKTINIATNGLIILITIFVILILMKYCLGISHILEEVWYVVIFVFLTEVIFLNVIVKNYEPLDTQMVKDAFYKSIKKHI